MVNAHKCPRCGTILEVPQLFSPTRQQIFHYIWDNPWCSMREIREAIYGSKSISPNVVSVHLSRIGDTLDDLGEYMLNTRRDPAHHGSIRFYRIIKAKKGTENALADITPILR